MASFMSKKKSSKSRRRPDSAGTINLSEIEQVNESRLKRLGKIQTEKFSTKSDRYTSIEESDIISAFLKREQELQADSQTFDMGLGSANTGFPAYWYQNIVYFISKSIPNIFWNSFFKSLSRLVPCLTQFQVPSWKSYLFGPLIGELDQICLFGGCLFRTHVPFVDASVSTPEEYEVSVKGASVLSTASSIDSSFMSACLWNAESVNRMHLE